jgi:acetyltransferase-like isoleucine patch superfamily enzyme
MAGAGSVVTHDLPDHGLVWETRRRCGASSAGVGGI